MQIFGYPLFPLAMMARADPSLIPRALCCDRRGHQPIWRVSLYQNSSISTSWPHLVPTKVEAQFHPEFFSRPCGRWSPIAYSWFSCRVNPPWPAPFSGARDFKCDQYLHFHQAGLRDKAIILRGNLPQGAGVLHAPSSICKQSRPKSWPNQQRKPGFLYWKKRKKQTRCEF